MNFGHFLIIDFQSVLCDNLLYAIVEKSQADHARMEKLVTLRLEKT